MGFELPANPGDPGQPDSRAGRVDGAEAGAHRLLVRDGSQVLAHGALICPSCALPIAAAVPFSAGSRVVCGYCEHEASGRDFLAEDVYDTVANEVYLVARVA
jgi:hypothetical protein